MSRAVGPSSSFSDYGLDSDRAWTEVARRWDPKIAAGETLAGRCKHACPPPDACDARTPVFDYVREPEPDSASAVGSR
jgi:hypothetical protein